MIVKEVKFSSLLPLRWQAWVVVIPSTHRALTQLHTVRLLVSIVLADHFDIQAQNLACRLTLIKSRARSMGNVKDQGHQVENVFFSGY